MQADGGRGPGGRGEPARGPGSGLGREEAAQSPWRSAARPPGCGECEAEKVSRQTVPPELGRAPPRYRARETAGALAAAAPPLHGPPDLGLSPGLQGPRQAQTLPEVLDKGGPMGELGMLPFRASGCPGMFACKMKGTPFYCFKNSVLSLPFIEMLKQNNCRMLLQMWRSILESFAKSLLLMYGKLPGFETKPTSW